MAFGNTTNNQACKVSVRARVCARISVSSRDISIFLKDEISISYLFFCYVVLDFFFIINVVLDDIAVGVANDPWRCESHGILGEAHGGSATKSDREGEQSGIIVFACVYSNKGPFRLAKAKN